MQVHRDINALPRFKNAVITIGTFDGVHKGHLKIIHQLKKEAAAHNGESVIITFHPHPRMIIRAKEGVEKKVYLLNTLDEKIELLAARQIDHLVVVPFTESFSNQNAEDYISEFLVEKFHPGAIIIGYDHRFGKDRKGDYQMLEEFQEKFDYSVKEIPEQVLHHITVSSTKIRNALLNGEIETANEFLGYDYFFEGRVIEGNKLGRTLGYPTANLEIENENKLIPADGIYAVSVALQKESTKCPPFVAESFHHGMMSIGIRPTIGDNKRMIEVNILDFDKNIYGRCLRVYVKEFLRNEEKFPSLEALQNQMKSDESRTRQIFNQ